MKTGTKVAIGAGIYAAGALGTFALAAYTDAVSAHTGVTLADVLIGLVWPVSLPLIVARGITPTSIPGNAAPPD